MKMWKTSDEWKRYANCGNSIDHTIPPERPPEEADKPVADPDKVRRICDHCRVRPECAIWATKPGPDSPIDVWAVGEFIPVDKRKARRAKERIRASIPQEFLDRGEDV